jgi:Ca-activated chloride channel family protein
VAVGVGSAIDRGALRRIANAGGGEAVFVSPLEPMEGVLERIEAAIDRAPLTRLRVDWGAHAIAHAAALPTHASGPFVVFARYERGGHGPIVLRGKRGAETWSERLPLRLPARGEADPAVARLFEAARLADGAPVSSHTILTTGSMFVATPADAPSDRTHRLAVEQPQDLPAS